MALASEEARNVPGALTFHPWEASLLPSGRSPSLPFLEKAPLPAPSLKKSRKVFEGTDAQVSCGENSGEAETGRGKTGQ